MLAFGIFDAVNDEVGEIIVAEISAPAVRDLARADSPERERLITRGDQGSLA